MTYQGLDTDIINALKQLTRNGYPVVASWQVALWLSSPYHDVSPRTIRRRLARLAMRGDVKYFFDVAPRKRGYMLPRHPSLSEVIAGIAPPPIPLSRQLISKARRELGQ